MSFSRSQQEAETPGHSPAACRQIIYHHDSSQLRCGPNRASGRRSEPLPAKSSKWREKSRMKKIVQVNTKTPPESTQTDKRGDKEPPPTPWFLRLPVMLGMRRPRVTRKKGPFLTRARPSNEARSASERTQWRSASDRLPGSGPPASHSSSSAVKGRSGTQRIWVPLGKRPQERDDARLSCIKNPALAFILRTVRA